MDITIQNQLLQDFETYMGRYYAAFQRFGLEDFGNFSSTIINYYVNNRLIPISNKKDAAYYLTTLYNKGIGNRITEEHLQMIAETIAADSNVDFEVVKLLFN